MTYHTTPTYFSAISFHMLIFSLFVTDDEKELNKTFRCFVTSSVIMFNSVSVKFDFRFRFSHIFDFLQPFCFSLFFFICFTDIFSWIPILFSLLFAVVCHDQSRGEITVVSYQYICLPSSIIYFNRSWRHDLSECGVYNRLKLFRGTLVNIKAGSCKINRK